MNRSTFASIRWATNNSIFFNCVSAFDTWYKITVHECFSRHMLFPFLAWSLCHSLSASRLETPPLVTFLELIRCFGPPGHFPTLIYARYQRPATQLACDHINLVSPVKVHDRDVEAVNMRWYDCEDEEDAIEAKVQLAPQRRRTARGGKRMLRIITQMREKRLLITMALVVLVLFGVQLGPGGWDSTIGVVQSHIYGAGW